MARLNLQALKRGEVLKSHGVERFQIGKPENGKFDKGGRQPCLVRKGLHFFNYKPNFELFEGVKTLQTPLHATGKEFVTFGNVKGN